MRQEELRLENERKARKALMKMLMKAVAKCFANWSMYTEQMRAMKALYAWYWVENWVKVSQWCDTVEEIKESARNGQIGVGSRAAPLAEIAAREAVERERMRNSSGQRSACSKKFLSPVLQPARLTPVQGGARTLEKNTAGEKTSPLGPLRLLCWNLASMRRRAVCSYAA